MRRAALVLSVVLLLAIPVAAAEGIMRARALPKSRAQPVDYDARWTLPRLRVSEDEREYPERVDLLREMKALATREFPFVEGEQKLRWTRSFGDLIRGLREAKGDPDRRGRMLAILRKQRPSVWKVVGPYLPDLVDDDLLYSEDWDPEDEDEGDGILAVEPFDRSASDQAPWNALDGTTDVHQAATVIWSDLDALKASENDFAAYDGQRGSDYEEVWGIRDSYVRGVDRRGDPFTLVRMWFLTDLAFPYSDCSSDVRIRTTLDDDGHACTDIYGTSEDFYWLAGQDVSIPLRALDGEFVALLQVRAYGFDIKSVPDGDGARAAAIRTSMGNLRLRAERYYREQGGKPRTVEGAIPEFVVRGIGPAPAGRKKRGD